MRVLQRKAHLALVVSVDAQRKVGARLALVLGKLGKERRVAARARLGSQGQRVHEGVRVERHLTVVPLTLRVQQVRASRSVRVLGHGDRGTLQRHGVGERHGSLRRRVSAALTGSLVEVAAGRRAPLRLVVAHLTARGVKATVQAVHAGHKGLTVGTSVGRARAVVARHLIVGTAEADGTAGAVHGAALRAGGHGAERTDAGRRSTRTRPAANGRLLGARVVRTLDGAVGRARLGILAEAQAVAAEAAVVRLVLVTLGDGGKGRHVAASELGKGLGSVAAVAGTVVLVLVVGTPAVAAVGRDLDGERRHVAGSLGGKVRLVVGDERVADPQARRVPWHVQVLDGEHAHLLGDGPVGRVELNVAGARLHVVGVRRDTHANRRLGGRVQRDRVGSLRHARG
mmetsp:Transcript_4014/g.13070  ORF Transcript_4014/g.13070 Transcript_4014/m.13070 type:complete len:399 (+) Transcript_4014:468-1664(+)